MDKFYYNKSGRVAAYIARDCLVMELGDQLPTISEYCTRFDVSRGIVQNALAFLQSEGVITVRTGGARGSYLSDVNSEKIIQHTGWDAVSASIPLPFDIAFSSLATALSEALLARLPLPSSFAYISGSAQRMRFLEKRSFDFGMFSLSTATHFLKKDECYEPPIFLKDCSYSYPFSLFIQHTEKKICKGMRVLHDPNSHDHSYLTRQIVGDTPVTWVELPYVAFSEVLEKDLADLLVVRNEPWTQQLKERGFQSFPLPEFAGYTRSETTTPVLLVHKNNYGMHRLLNCYLDSQVLCRIQQQVLSRQRPVRLY